MRIDEDRFLAAVRAVGRSGAKEFTVGFLDDDAPKMEDARWWAHALYRGRRVTVENHAGPDVAADALAAQILEGGTCTGCHRTVTVRIDRPLTGLCLWVRHRDDWLRGCDGKGTTRDEP